MIPDDPRCGSHVWQFVPAAPRYSLLPSYCLAVLALLIFIVWSAI